MITGGKEQKGKRTLVSSIIRFWAVKKKTSKLTCCTC